MNERIKELRKALGLTQQAFADRLKVKRNTVATYEMGRSGISDATLSLICKEFNVNEAWLRTGEGEMFISLSRDEEIAAFMGDVLKGEQGDFRRRLISALSRLDANQWEVLEQIATNLADEIKEAGPEGPAMR